MNELDSRLEAKVILIIGASGGMNAAPARTVAGADAQLILHCHRDWAGARPSSGAAAAAPTKLPNNFKPVTDHFAVAEDGPTPPVAKSHFEFGWYPRFLPPTWPAAPSGSRASLIPASPDLALPDSVRDSRQGDRAARVGQSPRHQSKAAMCWSASRYPR